MAEKAEIDRIISVSVGISGAEDYASTFMDIVELVRGLGPTHDYVNVSAQVVGEPDNEPPVDEDVERLYHGEDTLFKINEVLLDRGFSEKTVTEIINTLQNAGILFRERPKSKGE